ncbi:MAG TPA: transglycosylase SLT domain-containing protein [Caulobacteraceae bacterium]
MALATVVGATVVLAFAGLAGAQDGVVRRIPFVAAPLAPPLSDAEAAALKTAFATARLGDRARFLEAVSALRNPEAQRLAAWVYADVSGDKLSFQEIDAYRRALSGWPRADKRQALAEKTLATAQYTPAQVVQWFAGAEPITPEGAMALAGALKDLGRNEEARALIRRFWRDRPFDPEPQQVMLATFGAYLTPDDHQRRLDMLLMGAQGPAAQALLPLVPPDHAAVAQARMDLRADRPGAWDRAQALPASVADDPWLAYEKARWLRVKDRQDEGFALLAKMPSGAPREDGQAGLYAESRQYFVTALQKGDDKAAYDVMARLQFPPTGTRAAETAFFAGWVALTKLHDPVLAARHFQAVRAAGQSPLTQSRALYWLGRAAEAQGKPDLARAYYRDGAAYTCAFYGQLSAEKAGIKTISLPPEPMPTKADRTAFESRSLVRGARILHQAGEPELLNLFLRQLSAGASRPEDFALLMDLAREGSEPFEAMMIGRTAASKGFVLPERMYPLLTSPPTEGVGDLAFTLAIARQESSFDPLARTSSARGVMMLRPDTARIVAKGMGVPYAESMLWDPDYNLRLGNVYLGQMVSRMGGSYLLAAAAYNAGVNRPLRWTPTCGDPRMGSDPADFIECVPYGETRDYMMRVMENLEVYRARLNGGTGPLTLSQDLKRETLVR